MGGIYRDVYLEAMPAKRWIDNVVVTTEFDQLFQDANLKIRAMISDRQKQTLPGNYPSPGKPYDLSFTLSTKDGKVVANRQITIPAHVYTDREVNMTMQIEEPNHWTAETPYLYNLTVELWEDGKINHSRTERVGFRQISTDGGVFRINGQAVKLRGINRHDEHPDVGRATTYEHWLQDITLMKEANINYVRLAHYTHAKGFIELCDEMGMYVGNEVSIGSGATFTYDPSFVGAILLRSYETVVRDLNSPSIVYWSVSNEAPLTSLQLAAVKLVKALDPTRPILMPWRYESWLPKELDILSVHYWAPQEYDELAGNSNRPIITTEYTHSLGLDGTGSLEACWKALTKHPSGVGGAIWMWADQGIKTPNPGRKNNMNQGNEYLRIDNRGWDGIVDSYRNPTRDYWEVKAVYAPVYPSVEKVTFIPGQASVFIPIQNDFDFTNLSSVKISWSIWEDEKEMATGNSSIEGAPHALSMLSLPIEKLKTIQPEKTYYARFIFSSEDGTEINSKTVELEPQTRPNETFAIAQTLSVTKRENVEIQIGDANYVFDPETGQLTSATLKGKELISDLRPIIWRELDPNERSIDSNSVKHAVDLNAYTSFVKDWKVKQLENEVIIQSEVEYVVNDKNRFTTTYIYTVYANGKLNIRYEISPKVEMPWIPMVGMSLQSPLELDKLRWLGRGPYDAYPNKQSATMLGVWGGIAGSKEVTGNKATRWIERSGDSGGIRIENIGYMNHSSQKPEIINVLSTVLSRPESSRKARDPFPLLRTDVDAPFVGEFSIVLY